MGGPHLQTDEARKLLLLVDDDESVRVTIRSILKYAFPNRFVIKEANTGLKAKRILSSHRIDLLITDRVHRPPEGLALAEFVAQTSPHTKMILCETDWPSDHPALALFHHVLKKPVDPGMLIDAVKEVITEPSVAILSPDLTPPRRKEKPVPYILIVDDERLITTMLQDLLEANFQGAIEVLVAHTGEEAMRLLQSQPVDLLVTDYIHPGPDGFTLAQLATQHWPQTKRILWSSGWPLHDPRANLFHRVFLKPCEPNELIETIQELLQQPTIPGKKPLGEPPIPPQTVTNGT